MTLCLRRRPRSAILLTSALLLAIATNYARAGAVLGVDVQDYIILYEGGGTGHQLSINNFGTIGIWQGDIGIAGSGKLAASGPGTLNGSIDFAAGNSGQASISNTTVNGPMDCASPTFVGTGKACFGMPSVQTIMNNLNNLSSTLGSLAATGTALGINTSSTQTVLASSGSAGSINGVNYRLFNVTSVSSNNGQNLIIKGDASSTVVLDVNTPGDAQFHGNVLLQDMSGKFFGDTGYAGLSPDQVLFNLYAGSGLTGGDKLDVNNNGNDAHPANIIYGDFLDPNGAVSFVNTRFVGRIFG
ncbi:MAG TPA: hypothetical protein VFB54_19635, partial [Burkholderiales bacterium]|nr:hypothetical protein [Burkholderiales bacterium]